MLPIITTISILAMIRIVRDSLYFMWLCQIKEYRIDRMVSHFKENRNISEKNFVFLSALFLIFVSYIVSYNLIFLYICLALVLFFFAFLQTLNEIKKSALRRPRFTIKTMTVFLAIISFYAVLTVYILFASGIMPFLNVFDIKSLYSFSTIAIRNILLFYISIPFAISFFVLVLNPFFNFQKKKIIKRAAEKMKGLKKIKVIGITGSYGKTSTKEFLYAILSEKFKVIKTEGNNNTNIGVAYAVLNKVNDDYDYFICEVGAYKIGEIAEICSIVKPGIGILTGINEQHIDLFGSIENTRKAKFELIEALPENGFAIINKQIEKYKPELKVKKIELISKNIANDIKHSQDHLEFKYKNHTFKSNIIGKHYMENMLFAIITAEYLGMNLEEIKKAAEKIKPTEYMIRKFNGPNNSIFIDDSYSANPDGVLAALEYLEEAYQNYKKIIVFPGIIELGDRSKTVHKKLFDRIAGVCDIAYILSGNNPTVSAKNKFVFEKDFDKVAEMIKNDLDKNTVVLFESRGAGVVMEKIKKLI